MNLSRNVSLVRIVIPNTAVVQAALAESPCSLTVRTPCAEVEVQISERHPDTPCRNRVRNLNGDLLRLTRLIMTR